MTLDPAGIRKMAEGYARAWCSRSPEAVAADYDRQVHGEKR